FLAKSAVLVDSTWPVSMPSSVLASVRPLYEVWLNDLSSKPPASDTMQALKSAAPAAGDEAVPSDGGAAVSAVPAPGGSAHPAIVSAITAASAGPNMRDFFTCCLLGRAR